MPKLKTNRGAAKRFAKTASGYKRRQAFRNHILTKMSPKAKRQLRSMTAVNSHNLDSVKQLLGE